jgi:endonuclease YncB( thermonuclease family)
MKKEGWIIILLIFLLIVINYPFLNKFLNNFLEDSETGFVERVIDGDTIVVEGVSVRMLGIDAPERNEKYFWESLGFLDNLVFEREVVLKFGREKTDKYGRKLAYVYFDGININKRMIEEGLANPYFPSGGDNYYDEFFNVWENCLKKNVNLCEKSLHVCSECISLDRMAEYFLIENFCRVSCDFLGWSISGEGRKTEVFPKVVLNKKDSLKVHKTDFSGSVFLRDNEGMLVFWGRF